MNWKLFVARRIYRSKEGVKEISQPAVRIATAGIAIGLAVMIVAVAVVVGFKHHPFAVDSATIAFDST